VSNYGATMQGNKGVKPATLSGRRMGLLHKLSGNNDVAFEDCLDDN